VRSGLRTLIEDEADRSNGFEHLCKDLLEAKDKLAKEE
jgi:hypothetical protein